MTDKMIEIAKDFSRFPAGRFYTDGPYSGQKFLEELLLPMLQETTSQGTIKIDLDRTRGYGSSFLEEAFGGMVRKTRPVSLEEALHKIKFISEEDDTLVPEIHEYMTDAFNDQHNTG